jgi:hypothetical protein
MLAVMARSTLRTGGFVASLSCPKMAVGATPANAGRIKHTVRAIQIRSWRCAETNRHLGCQAENQKNTAALAGLGSSKATERDRGDNRVILSGAKAILRPKEAARGAQVAAVAEATGVGDRRYSRRGALRIRGGDQESPSPKTFASRWLTNCGPPAEGVASRRRRFPKPTIEEDARRHFVVFGAGDRLISARACQGDIRLPGLAKAPLAPRASWPCQLAREQSPDRRLRLLRSPGRYSTRAQVAVIDGGPPSDLLPTDR